MASTAKPTDEKLDPAVVKTALILVVGALAVIFDTTIVSVALHTLARAAAHLGPTIQWVTTGYLLALGIAVPLSAWGLQRFGGKRLWMFSLTVFLVGSVGASLAWNAGSLIAWRVVQGVGGGLMLPLMITLIMQAAGGKSLGRTRHARRAAGAARPDPRPGDRRRHPHPPELAVHVLGERAVLRRRHPARLAVPASTRPPAGPRPQAPEARRARAAPHRAGYLGGPARPGQRGHRRRVRATPTSSSRSLVGVALLAAFTGYALRTSRPLVEIRLLAKRSVASSSAVLFFSGFSLYGAMLLMPLYYQDVRGTTALAAGVMLVPQGIGTALSRIVAGRNIDRFGSRVIALAGFAIVAAATVPFALAGPHTSEWLLALWMVIRGFGLGAVTMPVMVAGYIGLDKQQIPHASVLTRTAQQIGGSFGTAVLAVILEGAIAAHPATPADAFHVAFWWSAGFAVVACSSPCGSPVPSAPRPPRPPQTPIRR